MVIKILNKLLKLTMSLSEQLVELVKVALKREIKLKEKQITGLKEYKQQLNEELLIVESKLENLEIEKGELEKATETVVQYANVRY